jgi:hypothetical protein
VPDYEHKGAHKSYCKDFFTPVGFMIPITVLPKEIYGFCMLHRQILSALKYPHKGKGLNDLIMLHKKGIFMLKCIVYKILLKTWIYNDHKNWNCKWFPFWFKSEFTWHGLHATLQCILCGLRTFLSQTYCA